jgi:hypothetical protein
MRDVSACGIVALRCQLLGLAGTLTLRPPLLCLPSLRWQQPELAPVALRDLVTCPPRSRASGYDMGTEDLFLTSTETQHNHLEGAIVRGGLNWHVNWFGGGGYQGQY